MWTQTPLMLFSSSYIPHGHCYLWQTPLVGLHAISDFLIAIAYFSIPIALLYFVIKRENDFPVRLIVLFGLFIVLCGVGHLFDIITLWYPIYWVSGGVRAATALVSCYTAMEVAMLLPTFLALKSPQALEALNQQLQDKINEQIETEKALASTKEVFESSFEYAPSGMVLVSTNGFFLKVNEAFCNITGYAKEDLLASDFRSITHPDDLPRDLDVINTLLASEELQAVHIEKRYFHQQGHIIDINLSASLLRDAENTPLFFIAHIQDISEQKRVHASLENARKSSEEANQAKSEFLAMMSHEIRTPMNAMIGMTELIEETGLNEQQQEFVNVIRTSGNTLLTVINDILDFSKIESNKLELEMNRLDLYECIEEVLVLYSNQAQQKGLSLTSLIQPANIPSFFKGDAIRLRQIISNLVSNSIKFTETGEVSIQAQVSRVASVDIEHAEKESLETYQISFSIKDTGIGIPPEKLSTLFKSFSQVDASTTRKYGGTGLGLAICKRLVEMMHGDVWVDSAVGEGSTFNFSIQLAAYESSADNNKDERQVDLQQKRLLIIDSNHTSRRYLSLQAESWNLTVDTAPSAEVAISKLFREERPDIIAINEPLVDMETIQLASQIRNFPNYQTVPLVLIQSQKTRSTNRLNILGSQVKSLQKPARRSQFYNALVQLLLDNEDITAETNQPQSQPDISPQKHPLRILLTEDISLNQKVALTMLSSFGYTAAVANNGKEAVAALQKQTYDLVFMDIQMPEMDGLEATRAIRSDSHLQQPYIIAMTAHAMQGDREECISAGMSDYISKPIRKRDLAAALKQCSQHLSRTSPANSQAQPPSQENVTQHTETAAKISRELQDIPILDTQVLEGVSTEKEFLIEICQSFLTDAPERITAIESALAEEDSIAIKQTAHALKSLSSCVGAMSLFQICKFMEEEGKNNQVESAKPLLQEVNAQYQKAQVAICNYQNQL